MSNSYLERANPPPRRKTCLACTKAKRRCDHAQPACSRCSRRKIDCVYPSQPAARSTTSYPSNSVIPWSHDPHVLPLDLGELGAMTLDMGFDDLSYPDALLDEALSVPLPAAMTPRPDQMLVAAAHGSSQPPQTSVEEMVASRLQFALDAIKKVPSLMVLENQTPWCHPYLYRTYMPREMQDAQACCALYIAKNKHNSPAVLRTIQARAHEVLASPLPEGRLEMLARIEAILLYQIIRLFDGDIALRASAQQNLAVLERALVALLPFVKWDRAQPATGPAEEDQAWCPTKDFFHEWIFQESARRTLFFSCFFLVAHQILVGLEPPNGCRERYAFCESWTLSAHLWNASNVVDFAMAWREKQHFVINQQSFTEVLRDAAADDVDLFGRILMSGALGIEETRLWFYNRGGSL